MTLMIATTRSLLQASISLAGGQFMLLGIPNEDSYSGSSMVVERKSRIWGNESASYVQIRFVLVPEHWILRQWRGEEKIQKGGGTIPLSQTKKNISVLPPITNNWHFDVDTIFKSQPWQALFCDKNMVNIKKYSYNFKYLMQTQYTKGNLQLW